MNRGWSGFRRGRWGAVCTLALMCACLPVGSSAQQEALIREHYMTGEATGAWNQASEDAMRKYQADHGWQSKQVPDSRALIKLGLGPSQDYLLNPESAMITGPDAPRGESIPTTSHTAAPAADPPPPQNPNHNNAS